MKAQASVIRKGVSLIVATDGEEGDNRGGRGGTNMRRFPNIRRFMTMRVVSLVPHPNPTAKGPRNR